MKNKMISLVLCGAIALGALAGCGSTNTTKESNQNLESSEVQSSVVEEATEPVDITWLGYYTSNITVSEDTWAEKLIEEKCGFNLIPVTDVTQENMDVFIASGEILDVTCFTTYLIKNDINTMDKLYNDGIVREIPEEYLWEYYPTGMKNLVDFLGQEYFDQGFHKIDGKVLNTPYVGTSHNAKYGMFYRTDWAKKLGIPEPATLEEFHDMIYAFTYNDPDGNGQKDTYGLGGFALSPYQLAPVFGSYGMFSPKIFNVMEDGSVVYWGATEEYRNAMRIVKEWYDEGILDPEGLTDKRDANRTKWANGKVGVMGDNFTWENQIRAMVDDVAGKGTIDLIGQMTCDHGDGIVYMADKFYDTKSNAGLMFTADATDEQIITVLKYMEKLASDIEFSTLVHKGEEGVDYDVIDGAIINKEHVTTEYQASKGIGYGMFGVETWAEERSISSWNEEKTAIYNEMMSVEQGGVLDRTNILMPSEVAAQYQSEVAKVVDEYFAAVLLGNDNLDDGWDAYLKKLNAAGLDKILADYEEILK